MRGPSSTALDTVACRYVTSARDQDSPTTFAQEFAQFFRANDRGMSTPISKRCHDSTWERRDREAVAQGKGATGGTPILRRGPEPPRSWRAPQRSNRTLLRANLQVDLSI